MEKYNMYMMQQHLIHESNPISQILKDPVAGRLLLVLFDKTVKLTAPLLSRRRSVLPQVAALAGIPTVLIGPVLLPCQRPKFAWNLHDVSADQWGPERYLHPRICHACPSNGSTRRPDFCP